MTVKTFKGELDGSEMNIGIVVSRFNEYAAAFRKIASAWCRFPAPWKFLLRFK